MVNYLNGPLKQISLLCQFHRFRVCAAQYFPVFRPQVFFVRIYMFPVDVLLTEFAKQHFTRRIEVLQKALSSVFLPKQQVSKFFC